jgi:acyl-CoA synthetase (NDP forming)
MPPAERSLLPLFAPTSVAVVGASDDARKWGNWLARGALRGATRRRVYLVNRRAPTVLGQAAFRTLAELPEPPELVVIAVPSGALATAVDDALAAGARAIVAISSADNDSDSTVGLESSLARRARDAGAVLLGPNCMGVLDAGESLELVSNPLPTGAIGLISQSGNLALELGRLAAEEGLGFSRFVSLGNQADLDATALVRELSEHPATRLIALYMEDFRDGREFVRAAAHARDAGKPVVLLAIERGDATSRAVHSHTGALASDGAAIDAACGAAGIVRVRTPQALIDVAQALLRAGYASGHRLGVLGDGGGHGSIAAALASQAGIELPKLSDSLAGKLRAMLPPHAAVLNPVDLAGGAEQDVHAFERAARLLLESGELDVLLITGYFGGYGEYGPEVAAEERDVARRLGELARAVRKPIVVHTMYADSDAADSLREAGIPTFRTIDQAVNSLTRLIERPREMVAAVPALPPPAAPIDRHDYITARELLRSAGVPTVPQRTVTDAEQALAAAHELGYPVALKALGPLHKSDRGAVVLDVPGDDELRRAYDDLERRLAPASCSVEKMAPVAEGVELLIGTRWDLRFGPVALAASGGLHAELLRDTAVALAPVSVSQAEAMLRSLRAASLLGGARGRPGVDTRAAARALSALSRLAAAHPEIAEIEANPLLVTRTGALVLDARTVPAPATTHEQPPPTPTQEQPDGVQVHAGPARAA